MSYAVCDVINRCYFANKKEQKTNNFLKGLEILLKNGKNLEWFKML